MGKSAEKPGALWCPERHLQDRHVHKLYQGWLSETQRTGVFPLGVAVLLLW